MLQKGGSKLMLVLKKDALVKLLGDKLYGIELKNEMLQDLENRATGRREILDIVGTFAMTMDTIGVRYRQKPKPGSRNCLHAGTERTIGIPTPISN